MSNPEVENKQLVTEAEETQLVTRSIVVSLASPEELYKQFSEGRDREDVSVLRFYVGVKNGKIDPEIEQISGKYTQGIRYTLLGGKLEPHENEAEGIQREITEEAGVTPFGIGHQTTIGTWFYSSERSGPREVKLTYNPILPGEEDRVEINKGVIKGIKILDLNSFRRLIKEGESDGVPMEGHLTIKKRSKDKIKISKAQRRKRNIALAKGIGWMSHIEGYLQERFEKIFRECKNEEEFNREYDKVLSEYMRRGIEVGPKKAEVDRSEDILRALDEGFLGRDILYYLPKIAEHGIDWPGLDESTEGVKIFIRYLKEVFFTFLKNKRFVDEGENVDIEAYRLYMTSKNVTLSEKQEMINSLDVTFREKLRKTFNLSEEQLNFVLYQINSFFREISNEMKVADPGLVEGLYQDFTIMNEVNNASLGNLLSLFSAGDIKENSKRVEKKIRFESGRHLLLLLKGLIALPSYRKMELDARSGNLQSAVNTFFGSVIEETSVRLEGSNRYMKVGNREKNGHKIIVDFKPIKTFASLLRKSFEERLDDIHDLLSVNIVLYDDTGDNIEFSKGLVNEFITYLRDEFKRLDVSTGDIRTYGTERYSKGEGLGNISGRRKGSMGGRLVRTKMIIQLGNEYMELVIYPFRSIEDSEFWGWRQKISDDKDYVVRRLLSGQNGIPSTYDLFFPPDMYQHNYHHRLLADYHK